MSLQTGENADRPILLHRQATKMRRRANAEAQAAVLQGIQLVQ